MVVIAIAGGTGDLGRTIVQSIVDAGKHTVYVLTRKKMLVCSLVLTENFLVADIGSRRAREEPRQPLADAAKMVEVDYLDPSDISNVLSTRQVDTVISAINLHWEGSPEAQLNLICGASESGVVRNFIPSEFNIDYNVSEDRMPYPARIHFLEAVEELKRHPRLTYSLIRVGFFMDYLGLPFMETPLQHLYCVVDLSSAIAVVPGDGTEAVVFSHTKDVARCVAALIDIPSSEWPQESAVIGERIVLNDLVALAERVTGRPFTRSFNLVEDLRKNKTTEFPSNKKCYPTFPNGKADLDTIVSSMMVGMATGVFDIQGTNLLELFPSIQPTTLNTFISEAWSIGRGKRETRSAFIRA